MEPIWKRTDITVTEYRLIWFLVDIGCMGHVATRGWVNKCASEMGMHRTSINRAVSSLIRKGLLVRPCKGNVEFNPDGFISTLPEGFIRLKEMQDADS